VSTRQQKEPRLQPLPIYIDLQPPSGSPLFEKLSQGSLVWFHSIQVRSGRQRGTRFFVFCFSSSKVGRRLNGTEEKRPGQKKEGPRHQPDVGRPVQPSAVGGCLDLIGARIGWGPRRMSSGVDKGNDVDWLKVEVTWGP
jgi:hypothetical protein